MGTTYSALIDLLDALHAALTIAGTGLLVALLSGSAVMAVQAARGLRKH